MNPTQLHQSEPDLPLPHLASLRIQPTSPRVPSNATPTAGSQRRIAIAVDLSDESAYAVRWAVQNYLRPGDAVILLHVRPTSVLYGADWGSIQLQITPNATTNHENATAITSGHPDGESQQKLENDFDIFTTTKANTLAQPLVDAQIPFKIHIVKDHDMKERLCLEVERLGLSAVIMGSRGFGAARRTSKGRLGSVSDYCVHHCICPVVVVRFPEEEESEIGGAEKVMKKKMVGEDVELQPVPEEELEYHDAEEEHRARDERQSKNMKTCWWQRSLRILCGDGFECFVYMDSNRTLGFSLTCVPFS
ncbi:Adenine nucleotide alpha hydrolases-like superfamily protein isoform 4 [Theobroma cacao]|uniref:Adenine nucleotide alpha hydrolases-like superfamily protein isoform 4 n=1 Tax=Theobroma cacao TaxID=3641 RepID=A0A061E2T8_THECC|nr:Adenine nucleotide alpha hydrolases-like superfamily protein isoform 4 [Theobroma cacao]